jgi:hypothetical protein
MVVLVSALVRNIFNDMYAVGEVEFDSEFARGNLPSPDTYDDEKIHVTRQSEAV